MVDKESNTIKIEKLSLLVEEIHKELMGNGRKGLLKEWSELKGQISVWKYLAASGGLSGIGSLIMWLIKK